MPNKTALTTIESAKVSMGIALTDASEDELIEQLINAASEWLESECNRKFVQRDYNGGSGTHATTSVEDEDYYYHNGDGSGVIVLPNYPVDSGSTFALDYLTDRTNSGGETWDTDDYLINDEFVVDWDRGIIRLLDNLKLVNGIRNYRVTYSAGYDSSIRGAQDEIPWVPADLQRACNELLRDMKRNMHNVSSEKIGTWSRTYNLERPNPVVQNALSKYMAHSNLIA